jgi:ABC-2 type transport system permease protein
VGGLTYMILCMSFIGIVIMLEAWPVYVLFMSRLPNADTSSVEISGAIASLTAAFALTVAVFFVSTRAGLKRLRELQP